MSDQQDPRPPEQVINDVDQALRCARMAVDHFLIDRMDDFALCSPADRTSATIRIALTYLVSNGLAQIADAAAWKRWIPVALDEPYEALLSTALHETADRRAAQLGITR